MKSSSNNLEFRSINNEEENLMAFEQVNSKGQTYYLHQREVTLKGGRLQNIFFFAKEIKDGAIDELPEGYEVIENTRTGLPILKKSNK